MSWIERLRESAYSSPDGTRFVFLYEDVSLTFQKKGTAFEFPDADGTFVQDKGTSSNRYPLRVIFSGADYDLTADAFLEALKQRGIGKLEHPIYGTKNVVPLGAIKRRDDLKSAGNQAIFELTFWESILAVYPQGQTDPQANILSAIDQYNTAAAEQFEENTSLLSEVERSSAAGTFTSVLNATRSGLQSIADVQDDVAQSFNTVFDSINLAIDTLIAEPLTLAFQTNILIGLPARALASITARLDAYRSLAGQIANPENIRQPSNDSQSINAFAIDDLFGSDYVIGSVISSINNRFETKTDALAAASALADQLDELISWRDLNFASLEIVDTGSAYQKLIDAVGLTLGFLVDISFDLKQERIIVLNRPRTVVDLVFELYDSVDDQLDFFITSNDLSGDEYFELPVGREVKYYV